MGKRGPKPGTVSWPDKRPGKRTRRTSGSKALTQQQAVRRRHVVDLLNRGLHSIEIAQALKLAPQTVRADIAAIERGWHERNLQDWTGIRLRELAKLEAARDAAWSAFKTAANRHGERLQNGYLTSYLKACEQIAKLLQLTDSATQINLTDQSKKVNLQFVEIRSRDELEAYRRHEAIQLDKYLALTDRVQ